MRARASAPTRSDSASDPSEIETRPATTSVAAKCKEGDELSVHFYDAGQALAALVTLPDGRRILVDAGEDPKRPGCGGPCKAWNKRVADGLAKDLGQAQVDMLWITHQHSDHLGGVPSLANIARPKLYVDNGTQLDKAGVKKAREAAEKAGATIEVVDPSNTTVPLPSDDRVSLSALLPKDWPEKCEDNPNNCSIALRIDYCRSSILFVGDAEVGLEGTWHADDVDLLQVGHHGSDTSCSQGFIAAIKPDYAVVSCGDRDEGTNKTYCHPRRSTIEALTTAMGGPGSATIEAFDAEVSCKTTGPEHWKTVKASDRLWVTARDGDVELVTTGDGKFDRR